MQIAVRGSRPCLDQVHGYLPSSGVGAGIRRRKAVLCSCGYFAHCVGGGNSDAYWFASDGIAFAMYASDGYHM